MPLQAAGAVASHENNPRAEKASCMLRGVPSLAFFLPSLISCVFPSSGSRHGKCTSRCIRLTRFNKNQPVFRGVSGTVSHRVTLPPISIHNFVTYLPADVASVGTEKKPYLPHHTAMYCNVHVWYDYAPLRLSNRYFKNVPYIWCTMFIHVPAASHDDRKCFWLRLGGALINAPS